MNNIFDVEWVKDLVIEVGRIKYFIKVVVGG